MPNIILDEFDVGQLVLLMLECFVITPLVGQMSQIPGHKDIGSCGDDNYQNSDSHLKVFSIELKCFAKFNISEVDKSFQRFLIFKLTLNYRISSGSLFE